MSSEGRAVETKVLSASPPAERLVVSAAPAAVAPKTDDVKVADSRPTELRALTEARQASPLQSTSAAEVPVTLTPPASTTAPVREANAQPAPVPKQWANDGLARAADYMASGRIANARSLLEDQARSGDAAALKALGETYDPLHLREAYPKLARAGDPAKAMAAYEKAKVAGADDLEGRIDALRTLLAARQ